MPILPDTKELESMLKAKYGKVTKLTIGTTSWYLKKPDFNTMAVVMKVHKDSPLEASKILFINCLVEGPGEVVDNIDDFLSIHPHLESLIELREVEVKNL
jgi:hypothetical protein